MTLAIITHGGAGAWEEHEIPVAHEGLIKAVEAGIQCLQASRGALDACEEVIKTLEDIDTFNAGFGSVLNLEGECEMDACIMKGSTLEAGACVCVRMIRHPITLARMIMEKTEHIMLVQQGAERLARQWGLEERDPRTQERIKQWRRELTQRSDRGRPTVPGATVGCVVLDQSGEIVAGTSTGGLVLKLPGRMGDSPVLGAGTYATRFAGASSTGHGEAIMRVLLTKEVSDLIEQGMHPDLACKTALKTLDAGVIALSSSGEVGMGHNCRAMPVVYWKEGMNRPATWY